MRIPKAVYLLFAVVLVVGLLPLTVGARPEVQAKIAPDLLARLTQEGTANYFVMMSVQADLSAAYSMDWAARGQYVYDALREVARVSQAPVIDYAQRHNLDYTSFFNGNEVFIRGGTLAAAQDLAALPGVASLQVEEIYEIPVPTVVDASLPTATTDWGITDTGAPSVWSTYARGAGIVVANIDTGVDSTHVALNPNYKCGSGPHTTCWLDPGTQNCTPPGGAPCDTWAPYYHGTHTMGTMVAKDNPSLAYIVGMAPDAKWIACLGCPNGSCPTSDLNACADWIVAPGGNPSARPNIVNNSWGGGGGDTWYLSKVQAWRAAGIFPAFSAGNSGSGCNTLGSPGDYQESFGSAAHDSTRTIASFSSRGPSAFGHTPYTKPNISAPGVNIMSTKPGNTFQLMSGTSMASPHSAGAVALIWSACPSYLGQIDSTFQLLQNNTDTPPAGNCGAPGDGGNYTYGYGYLDVLKAVQACATVCTPVNNAAFTWSPTSPVVGDLVTFTGTAAGTTPITYAWTFGDGGTGSGASVTHTYTAAGTYTVTMTATNCGGSQAVSHTVTVQPAPAYSLHLHSMALAWAAGTKPGTYKVTSVVVIHDQAHALAPGVTVSATWTAPNGQTTNQTAVTTAKGQAKFSLKGNAAGVYQYCVTNLAKTGYVYNPAGNETPACQTITVGP